MYKYLFLLKLNNIVDVFFNYIDFIIYSAE